MFPTDANDRFPVVSDTKAKPVVPGRAGGNFKVYEVTVAGATIDAIPDVLPYMLIAPPIDRDLLKLIPPATWKAPDASEVESFVILINMGN